MSLLAKYKESLNVVRTLVRNNSTELLDEILNELKVKYPDLEFAVVRGSTPNWNDGESCEHSTEILVTELEDYGYESDDEHYYNENLSESAIEEIEAILNVADDILCELYGTNYEAQFNFVDEAFVKVDDYDCGY